MTDISSPIKDMIPWVDEERNMLIIELPGGWIERVMIIKATDAARAVLRANQPGPNK